MDEFDSKVLEFKRALIKELLGKCSKSQLAFFNRLYGNIDEIPDERAKNAWLICKRTITLNPSPLLTKEIKVSKLKCGCTPDASGYGYCGECVKELRAKIWKNMNKGRKKYDRNFAPEESKVLDDSLLCCSCHINPPCDYCVSQIEEV